MTTLALEVLPLTAAPGDWDYLVVQPFGAMHMNDRDEQSRLREGPIALNVAVRPLRLRTSRFV